MFTSILEWATTILLIYGLIVILGIKVTLSQFFPIYVMAIIVAMISMVPSGVGTFDLTLLVGLKEFNVPSEQVLLLIILYRLSYYIIPVLIGLVLYLSDLYMKINEDAREVISRLNSKLAHCVLKIMLFITGISLIFGNNIYLKRYFPHRNEILNMDIVELSISLSIIIGFILIVLSTILPRRRRHLLDADRLDGLLAQRGRPGRSPDVRLSGDLAAGAAQPDDASRGHSRHRRHHASRTHAPLGRIRHSGQPRLCRRAGGDIHRQTRRTEDFFGRTAQYIILRHVTE